MDAGDRRAAADGGAGRRSGSDRVRVATWNLYLGADLSTVFGGSGRGGDLDTDLGEVVRQLVATAFELRAPLVARVLASQQADVVGLQEVCTWAHDEVVTTDFEQLLLGELAALGTPYDVVTRQATFRGAADLPEGLGGGRVSLVGHDVLMVRRGGPVHVESSHRGTFSRRLHLEVLGGHHQSVTRGWCAARCRLGETGPAFTFVTTHTEAHGAGARDRQRDELVSAVDDLVAAGTPTVLVGDFNAPPGEVGMPAGWQDAWTAAGHGAEDPAGHTSGQAPDLGNVESTLRQRIDYVFVRDAAVGGCRRIGADPADRVDGLWPSDHAGVAAEVSLVPLGPVEAGSRR